MKNIQYKTYSFRLEEKTNKEIKKLAEEYKISKNLLFASALILIKKYGIPEIPDQNNNFSNEIIENYKRIIDGQQTILNELQNLRKSDKNNITINQ